MVKPEQSAPQATKQRRAGSPTMVSAANPAAAYGAIDLGTNNCRLLVAIPEGDSFRVIDSFSRIGRLGEGLSASGKLSQAAMDRTIEALHVCASVMQRNNVTSYHAIATEACRRASNGEAFVERVLAETGIVMETVAAEREAELTFDGCSPLLDADVPHGLVFDIGGGSTELMWIDQSGTHPPRLAAYHSIPEGVVTLSERYGEDLNGEQPYERILEYIDPWLERFDDAFGISAMAASGHLAMLGTSGTVTTLGALHLGLRRYERSRVDGMVIDFESISTLNHKLAAMTCDSRASHPCIGPERADLVVMGCAILEAICRRWPVGRLRVADRGIREGLLMRAMMSDGAIAQPDPLTKTPPDTPDNESLQS